jgi:hypothetical protein
MQSIMESTVHAVIPRLRAKYHACIDVYFHHLLLDGVQTTQPRGRNAPKYQDAESFLEKFSEISCRAGGTGVNEADPVSKRSVERR